MNQTPQQIKEEICEIGRRIYQDGYVAANDGNISVKVDENDYYCTPTGVSKGFLTPEMICRVDAQGNKVEECAWRPSSEFKMHLQVFRDRPDVRAVVHAHPPTATGFAVAGLPLDEYIMPEAIIFLGTVPLTPYGTPSTDEIPKAIAPYLQNHDAFLLQNHGVLTVGVTLNDAFFRMETVEFYAKISLIARQLGGAKELPPEEIEKLMEVRKSFGVPGRHPGYTRPAGK